MTIAAFARMGALSTRNDEPERASRPFDADRDGFVIGEGAAFVVLERWNGPQARGATHLRRGRRATAATPTPTTSPRRRPGGAGAAACMQLALDDAGIEPSAIGHVNAHGTSTDLNDAAEAEAVLKVFGDDAPPVTSTKGVTGHLIGAAGAVEALASLLSVRDGHRAPDRQPRAHRRRHRRRRGQRRRPRDVGSKPALSNSFGFGGHNATLIVAPPSG